LGHGFLLVERYDRAFDENGNVKRLHQEDFCQALGYPSSRKYAADGGPVFRDCFQLLRSSATRPAREVLKLFDAAIFNLIIGNADAHGKNYSLLYRDDGVEMAPLYDLLSTVAYPDLSPKLAMKIAKRSTLAELKASDWSRFAEETGLTEPFVKRRAKELADAIVEEAEGAVESFQLTGPALEVMRSFSELASKRATGLAQVLR
jgi:serine/threonine-protein kinase HipA